MNKPAIIESASFLITYFRQKDKSVKNLVWIEWRETVNEIYAADQDSSVTDEAINAGKALGRKIKENASLGEKMIKFSSEEKQEIISLTELLRMLDENREDYVPGNFNQQVFEEIVSTSGLSDNERKKSQQKAKEWLELKKENKFFTRISVPASLKPVMMDFCIRWISLFIFRNDGFETPAKMIGLDQLSAFLLFQITLIPLFVLLYCIYREKNVLNATQALLNKTGLHNISITIRNSAWNYLLIFLLVIQGMLFTSFLMEGVELVILLFLAIVFGSYLLVLLKHFSKTVPVYKDMMHQLEEKKHRELREYLSADENDEEIVSLEVGMKSETEKMNAYVIEAALFGALAFSGFLTLVSSGEFSAENISIFHSGLMQVIEDIIMLEGKNDLNAATELLMSKRGLMTILCYETLFCSVFFLSVIASRLRFSLLADQIEKSLQLSKAFNQKEENLITLDSKNPTGIKPYNEKVRESLRAGYKKQDELFPIIEYMRFFRTLGISMFFVIVVTGGFFISVQLSFILLFIALLSLFYFRFGAINEHFKNFKTGIQEFYFRVNKYVNWVSWGLIIMALLLKSFRIPVANFVMLAGFTFLFIHHMLSLFVPVKVSWIKHDNTTAFGSSASFHKLLETGFKVGFSFFFLGYMFKCFHWPGASVLIVVGLIALSFYFFFVKKIPEGPAWLGYFMSFSIGTGLMAILFKMNHWGGGSELYFISLSLLTIATVLTFIFRKKIRPFLQRTVFILMGVTVLYYFPYTRFVMTYLTFNYTSFQKQQQQEKFQRHFFAPVSEGGLADAKTQEEIEELKTSIEEFYGLYKDATHPDDARFLNEYAWRVYEESENPVLLEAATTWSDISITISRDWMYLDTKAWLLYKLKHYDEALPVAEEAYEKGQDQSTKELIDKINAEKPVK